MQYEITQVCKELFPAKEIAKISHLDSGRMGSVYKVTFNNPEESICVKVLTKDHVTKQQDSDGWKLAYEHLGFDFKSYEDTQYFYFTIPYFEGQLFHCAIQYSLKARLEIIHNLIKATADIHSKGLIHRDLKCNNIIVNERAGNKVNIIDFGRSVNVFNSSNGKASAYIQDLHLPGQGTIPSNIRRIFQPYTAPEYFKKHYYKGSNIGFRSDYYSIAQLFRFLVPEYSYLADEILHTEGLDRNAAFSEFSDQINNILRRDNSNPKFFESDKPFSEKFTLYKKIIFFIRQILDRLFNRTFQHPEPKPKKINLGFFKDRQNLIETKPVCPILCR